MDIGTQKLFVTIPNSHFRLNTIVATNRTIITGVRTSQYARQIPENTRAVYRGKAE